MQERDRRFERVSAPWFHGEAATIASLIRSGEIVLELGAATSALGVHLAARAGWVFAAESRPAGLAILSQTLGVVAPPNLTLGPEAVVRRWADLADVLVVADWVAPGRGVGAGGFGAEVAALLGSAGRLIVVSGWRDRGAPGSSGATTGSAGAAAYSGASGDLDHLLVHLRRLGLRAYTTAVPTAPDVAGGRERVVVAIEVAGPRPRPHHHTTQEEAAS